MLKALYFRAYFFLAMRKLELLLRELQKSLESAKEANFELEIQFRAILEANHLEPILNLNLCDKILRIKI